MANTLDAAAAAERRHQAFELRKAGASYRSIGKALGVTHQSAQRYVDRVLDDLKQQTIDSAERYRTIQLERLNDMLFALWPAVKRGDTASIREARGIMEREAKLMGLDAPDRMEHIWQERARAYAQEAGLDPEEIIAEAQRLVAGRY